LDIVRGESGDKVARGSQREADADDMADRASGALVALRRILRATDLSARSLARDSGLTTSQLLLLRLIHRLGRPTPGAVAKAASLTQATVTALLDKLEGRGLVARARDTEDRRRVLISVTPAGDRALADAPDMLQEKFARRFAALPEWEQAFVVAALERVSALLDAERLDAAPMLDIGEIARLEGDGEPAKAS